MSVQKSISGVSSIQNSALFYRSQQYRVSAIFKIQLFCTEVSNIGCQQYSKFSFVCTEVSNIQNSALFVQESAILGVSSIQTSAFLYRSQQYRVSAVFKIQLFCTEVTNIGCQ
jgi:hypothetical protein